MEMFLLQKVEIIRIRFPHTTELPCIPDNLVSRKLLVAQLEKYNLKVTATRDGNEAIEGPYPLLPSQNLW